MRASWSVAQLVCKLYAELAAVDSCNCTDLYNALKHDIKFICSSFIWVLDCKQFIHPDERNLRHSTEMSYHENAQSVESKVSQYVGGVKISDDSHKL